MPALCLIIRQHSLKILYLGSGQAVCQQKAMPRLRLPPWLCCSRHWGAGLTPLSAGESLMATRTAAQRVVHLRRPPFSTQSGTSQCSSVCRCAASPSAAHDEAQEAQEAPVKVPVEVPVGAPVEVPVADPVSDPVDRPSRTSPGGTCRWRNVRRKAAGISGY